MPLVEINNNQIVTSSRQIAKSFSKQHKDVLKSISKLYSAQNCAQWFYKSSYKDLSGKSNIEYFMTRDGFSLLAMGFTGQKALQWKIKYIEAFNAMEQKLKYPQMLIPHPAPKFTYWKGERVLNITAAAEVLGLEQEKVYYALMDRRDLNFKQGEHFEILKRKEQVIYLCENNNPKMWLPIIVFKSGFAELCRHFNITNMQDVYEAYKINDKSGILISDEIKVKRYKGHPVVTIKDISQAFYITLGKTYSLIYRRKYPLITDIDFTIIKGATVQKFAKDNKIPLASNVTNLILIFWSGYKKIRQILEYPEDKNAAVKMFPMTDIAVRCAPSKSSVLIKTDIEKREKRHDDLWKADIISRLMPLAIDNVEKVFMASTAKMLVLGEGYNNLLDVVREKRKLVKALKPLNRADKLAVRRGVEASVPYQSLPPNLQSFINESFA